VAVKERRIHTYLHISLLNRPTLENQAVVAFNVSSSGAVMNDMTVGLLYCGADHLG